MRLLQDSALQVARSEILFADVAPGRVGIEITVRNLGEEPSPPTIALLLAAPLGAFVPWRPMTTLPVPALEPGGAHVLRTEALRPAPKPLGPPDRVPPRKLLTALGAADDRPQPPTTTLPPDINELLGHRNAHWAGNLNVFVGTKAVERHVAQALRIYPGRVNLAMFVVGSGCSDSYRFHLIGEGVDWGAKLYDATECKTHPLEVSREPPVDEDRWTTPAGVRMMMLALTPPDGCGSGSVEVHVTQRSSGLEAVVEFSLDPSAAGPGCFVV
jgi:hypothetical protein